MLRILSTLFAVTLALNYTAPAQARPNGDMHAKIVGGEEAAKGEFPFIVSLQGDSGHFCGGSLIRKDWVLTAAHCVADGSPQQVVIGLHALSDASSAEVFHARQVITHPQNNADNQDYDFALIQLDHDSKFAPITMNREEIRGATDFVTAGWGTTSSGGDLADNLMKVTVPFQDAAACEKAYPGKTTNTMICAGLEEGGKDSCQGDSGGPLTVGAGADRKLVGVVSWGEGCASPHKYGVYGKVSSATTWVDSVLK